MKNMRILVVDDDPDLLFLVAHGIKSLSPNYLVSTAPSAATALEQARKRPYNLIVSDYMMPDMTGLELVPEIQKIAPETRFVLMTAHHDTSHIRKLVKTMEIDGFVGKPFILPDLLNVIQQVAKKAGGAIAAKDSRSKSSFPEPRVTEKLKKLWQQTGAVIVLLANADGEPVAVVGEDNPAKVSRLASFVSGNFLAITELAALFGDRDASFRTSYYEGNSYNIFSYNLNGSYFLAVIFGVGVKPGSVWFYAKQTVAELTGLVNLHGSKAVNKNDVTLARDFNNLLGEQPDEGKSG